MAESVFPRAIRDPSEVVNWSRTLTRVFDNLFQGEGIRAVVLLGQLRGQTPLMGVIDGANTTFTVPYVILRDPTTGNPLTILFTKNLGIQVYGVDWTMSENPQQIVFTTPPLGGDSAFLAGLVCRFR